ncbi:aspartate aminotransferase family protein [Denitrificimonas caeni]|uniref:aspartate aminotransferase family protein n=1 Tax=Denitrificimonas caeni TaxID=521720 RepID=UPI0019651BC0|nr:aspartate aminotransferase family protein [Denitrificimonas caeni]
MSKVRDILAQNAFNLDAANTLDEKTSALVKSRLNNVGPTTMLFYQEPLHIVRGEGTWLYDSNGRQFLDVYNNVPSLGHCHPKVIEAVHDQMRNVNIHTRYLHETMHIYAEKLLGTMPESINRLVMTCTGTESNDLAMRLATTYTKKKGFIVSEAAYHGNSTAVTEVSPSAYKIQKLPDHVVTIPVAPININKDQIEEWFAQSVMDAIDKLEDRGYGCAALLIDTIFSSDGVYSDPKGFIKKGVDIVKSRGGLFIADEVQPGFGRTGESMWGFERHAVIPDIITMGKPMGNGYPVAGLASRLDLLESLSIEAGYFNTFGGSTVAAAAALAVLETIQEEGLIAKVNEVGGYLKNGLYQLQAQYPCISDVRGVGLFLGADVSKDGDVNAPDAERATAIMNTLRQNGVLLGGAGKYANTLKIRPPLCFNKSHADLFICKLEQAIKST